jgi:hypothetical protein
MFRSRAAPLAKQFAAVRSGPFRRSSDSTLADPQLGMLFRLTAKPSPSEVTLPPLLVEEEVSPL